MPMQGALLANLGAWFKHIYWTEQQARALILGLYNGKPNRSSYHKWYALKYNFIGMATGNSMLSPYSCIVVDGTFSQDRKGLHGDKISMYVR